LDAGFDKHMKEVWGVEKFDVVVGNPPYQDSEKVSANSSLWTKFLIKIFDNLLIKDGHLCFITPSSWMGSTENQRSGIKSIFTENNLLILNINCAKYFNGVGSSFSYYIIKNNKDYGFTEIDNGEKFKVNIKDLPFFPKSMNLTAIKIIKKLETFVDKIDISSSLRNDKFDDNGEYKVWYGSNFKNSKIKGLNSDIKKVIVNLPGYLKPRYDDGLYATSKNNFWIPVKDSEEGKSLISYLNSSLIKYIIEKECKYSGFNNIGVMKFIPKIPFDREWSDEQLFEYFDISDEEKKLILQ
jgi:23S rRNA A1618 N6-methylase RlmF